MVSILRELQNLSEKKRKYTLKEYVTIQWTKNAQLSDPLQPLCSTKNVPC